MHVCSKSIVEYSRSHAKSLILGAVAGVMLLSTSANKTAISSLIQTLGWPLVAWPIIQGVSDFIREYFGDFEQHEGQRYLAKILPIAPMPTLRLVVNRMQPLLVEIGLKNAPETIDLIATRTPNEIDEFFEILRDAKIPFDEEQRLRLVNEAAQRDRPDSTKTDFVRAG